jgi:glycosyltransferase involved in cell wall biosynthesis
MSSIESPIVSVVMNCYNSDQYLSEAIESIYAQTFTDWEIIFWDNASTDNSAEIAKSFDSKVKYFKVEKTTPLGEARVLAVEKTKGKYLAFLDCDDYWLPQKLQLQIEVFEKNPNIAGVYGVCELVNEDSSIKKNIPKNSKIKDGYIFNELVKEDFIPFPSVVLDKEKFSHCGGFPAHFKSATDYWVLLHLSHEYEFKSIKGVCCGYRTHQSNLSHKLGIVSVHESIELVSLFLPEKGAILGLKHQYVNLAIIYFRDKLFYKSFAILLRKKIILLAFKRIIQRLF